MDRLALLLWIMCADFETYFIICQTLFQTFSNIIHNLFKPYFIIFTTLVLPAVLMRSM